MNQLPFLIRHPQPTKVVKRLRTVQASRVYVSKVERTRTKGYVDLPGFGRARMAEGTGRYHTDFLRVRNIDGGPRPNSKYEISAYMRRSAAGVKALIRRLRPQEAAELDAIDTECARLNEELLALYAKRAEVLERAWKHGHVVTLKEVDTASINGGTVEGAPTYGHGGVLDGGMSV